MKIEEFLQRLEGNVLVADGAMGTMLFEAVGMQRSFEELNLTHPEAVLHVHQAYVQAGAQVIETNTFGANRSKLAALGLADRVTEINHRGVRMAREARDSAAHEVFIAGSMGPVSMTAALGDLPREEILAAYREQSSALEDRGVDFFILETFSHLDLLLLAVEAIRSCSALPIVAQMTFSGEGTTLGGMPAAEAAVRLAAAPVQAIGTNCTLGPQYMLPVVEAMSGAGKPISAMPNAGLPQRVGDRVVYPRSSPEYFAQFAREAVALGARMVGGCCGTSPDHIRAIAEAVRGLHSGRAASSAARVTPAAAAPAAAAMQRDPESKLFRKLQAREFVISVEIDPPRGVALDRVLEQVDKIMASGQVDTIDINSGSMARVGMDAIMVAGALEARGIETIPHLTTRDANLIGLQALLLGGWTVSGVRNVLAITGDPPTLGDHPDTNGVYEIDAIGLVKVMSRLNRGTDWSGKALGGATNYTIGVALNPVAEDLDYEIARFHAKIEAGAHFAMTQPLFDPEHWHAFLKRLGGPPPIPVMVGVWPLSSYKQAMRLNNEVPGISIPEPVLRQMEAAGTNARDCGFAVGRRMLDWARTELAGVYIVPPFKKYDDVLDLFR
jgi:methionine synthase / methylenetetrahydrofolate reductase(NADPH)